MAIELQKWSYYSFLDFYIYYEFQKYTLVLKLIKELFGGVYICGGFVSSSGSLSEGIHYIILKDECTTILCYFKLIFHFSQK